MCRGDGVVWRPSPVQLDHPAGKTPPWLQFRGRFGAAGCIPLEGFWKSQGEPLRRCSAEVGEVIEISICRYIEMSKYRYITIPVIELPKCG